MIYLVPYSAQDERFCRNMVALLGGIWLCYNNLEHSAMSLRAI